MKDCGEADRDFIHNVLKFYYLFDPKTLSCVKGYA